MIHALCARPGQGPVTLGACDRFRVSSAAPNVAARRSKVAVNPTEVKRLIEQGLAATEISVESADDTHFQALVVSAEFTGKRPLLRHQLVYATLGPRMGREIHALSLRTLTPEEWQRERGAAPADSGKG